MQKSLTEALHEIFRPEFINRLDETIVFRSLTKQEINVIVELELDKVRLRLNSRNLELDVTEAAKSFLSDKGYDPEYGARPLRRVIQRHVEDTLSDMLLSSPAQAGLVTIDLNTDKDEIKIDIEKKEMSVVEKTDSAIQTEEQIDPVTT